ncbi:ubiquitin carboxyl-terminal hydrolase 8-like [Ylistrum balloti]|uniref:ubiquitin carboxyl-terminal hydrolase 8-like n=1 Tax=Ylistrum balloti TaxID=509963 RepID=UPI00290586A4|nr:ubiquitin carboxyl-terminal hydrolase 8-like [Ylistrum balloti]
MPGRTLKDTYMAKSMSDLNKLVEISKQKLGNNPKLLIKTSDTMLKGAEESDMLGDEEKAYVLFMRFFHIITAVKKMPEYRKQKEFYDKLIGQKNVMKCLDKAETLSKSLKNRYDFSEAQEIAKKLSSLEESASEEKKSDEHSDVEAEIRSDEDTKKSLSKESTPEPEAAPPTQPQGQITPVQLFSLLNETDEQMAIMDVRPTAEYEESHIRHRTCISVPAEIVSPGTTVTVIEKALPEDSKSLWQRRGHLNHIVLVDWSSTLDKVTIGTTLRTLKDALFKYDSTVIIRSEPVILEGGYDQWLYHYPQLTTNPHIKHSSVPTISSAPSLDFDYPDDINVDDILNPKKTENSPDLSNSLLQFSQGMTDQSEAIKQLPQVNGDMGRMMPRIDRSTKPKPGTNQNAPQNRPITTSVTSKESSDLYPSMSSLASPSRSLNGSERSNAVPESSKITADDSVSLESKSNSALSKYSEELEKEKAELEHIRQQKAEELASFQKEKERIAKERESRIEKLKHEENQILNMEQMKAVQAKDLADLLRKKKKLEEDIRKETTAGLREEERKYQEEEARKVELARVQQEEEDKQQRMEAVMRLRQERKKKEAGQDAVSSAHHQANQIEEENQQKLREASERAEKLRQENERKKLAEQRDKEAREKATEEARRRDQERKEREAQAQIDARKRQQEEQQRQKEERNVLERAKQEKEREEKERKIQEEKSRADMALRLAQDKMKRLNDKPQVRTIPSPNLPEGWEKQRDNKTGRYFYVDHRNSRTQWEPPMIFQPELRKDTGIQDPLRTPQREVYKTKLKDESEQGRSGGLKRSFSSPDISKLMEDDGHIKPNLPSVDRTKKPSQRVEPRPQPASTRPRNLNPTYGNVGSALTGLRNLGNTCYMNSIIQCLNNCAPLVQYFLTDRYLYDINRDTGPDSSGYQVVDEFVVIVKALWSGQYRNITPRDFKYIVGKYQPMFAGYDQQDSQEFLTFVMDGLNEGLNKVKVKPKLPDSDSDKLPDIQAAELAWRRHCLIYQSIIVDLFQGMLRSTLMCLTCRHRSVTFEVFMYLSLPIPSGSRCSLQDCLQEFVKAEKMTGSSRWKCPNCRVERDAEKKIDIWKLPPLLIIALNRFVWEGMWRQKINSFVDFPVNDLSLDKFVRGPSNNSHYQLYGVSNHYGTMDGGHYTAYCKNAVSKKWNKFDDHEVFEMSSSEVKTSAGFVLFYTTVNFTAPTYRQPF